MNNSKLKLKRLAGAVNATLDVLQAVQYGEIEGEDLTPEQERLYVNLCYVLDDLQALDSSL